MRTCGFIYLIYNMVKVTYRLSGRRSEVLIIHRNSMVSYVCRPTRYPVSVLECDAVGRTKCIKMTFDKIPLGISLGTLIYPPWIYHLPFTYPLLGIFSDSSWINIIHSLFHHPQYPFCISPVGISGRGSVPTTPDYSHPKVKMVEPWTDRPRSKTKSGNCSAFSKFWRE